MVRGESPFRFENMWLKTEGFVERVKSLWDCYSFSGTPSFVLAKKLKAVREDLKRWNKRKSGNLGINKKKFLGELARLDVKEGVHGLIDEEKSVRDEVKAKLYLISMEEISCRQIESHVA